LAVVVAFCKLKQYCKSDDDDDTVDYTNSVVKAHKVLTVKLTLYKYNS